MYYTPFLCCLTHAVIIYLFLPPHTLIYQPRDPVALQRPCGPNPEIRNYIAGSEGETMEEESQGRLG